MGSPVKFYNDMCMRPCRVCEGKCVISNRVNSPGSGIGIIAQHIECYICEGKGGFNDFGPCPVNDFGKSRNCPACEGSQVLQEGVVQKCLKCDGKGGLDDFKSPVEFYKMNAIKCPECEGRCIISNLV